MTERTQSAGRILRVFEVQAKPGRAADLLAKFAVTSAEVVNGQPGNLGYYFGQGVGADDDHVVFTSVWRDLDAVKARFGADWQKSYLPPGYEELIETCSVRHVDVGAGWHVEMERGA